MACRSKAVFRRGIWQLARSGRDVLPGQRGHAMGNKHGAGYAEPGKAGWILFPPVSASPLDQLSKLARVSEGRLAAIQTPPEWMADQRYLVYCFRCLVLNDVDVSAPRWKREWLDPEAEYCTAHHSLLETVPASIFGKAANFGAAMRAISRYRTPRFPRNGWLR